MKVNVEHKLDNNYNADIKLGEQVFQENFNGGGLSSIGGTHATPIDVIKLLVNTVAPLKGEVCLLDIGMGAPKLACILSAVTGSYVIASDLLDKIKHYKAIVNIRMAAAAAANQKNKKSCRTHSGKAALIPPPPPLRALDPAQVLDASLGKRPSADCSDGDDDDSGNTIRKRPHFSKKRNNLDDEDDDQACTVAGVPVQTICEAAMYNPSTSIKRLRRVDMRINECNGDVEEDEEDDEEDAEKEEGMQEEDEGKQKDGDDQKLGLFK